MPLPVVNKDCTVFLIDPASTVRTLYRQILSKYGYEKLIPSESLSEAIKDMPKEGTLWVIAPLFSRDKFNGFEFLNKIAENPKLNVFMTAVVDPTDAEALRLAFECGIVSYFKRPFTPQTLAQDFVEFFDTARHDQGNGSWVAAHYLRKHLSGLGKPDWVVAFEELLSNNLPPHPQLFLHLASAYMQVRDYTKVMASLGRIQTDDAGYRHAISKMKELAVSAMQQQGALNLGISEVVLVDPDSGSVKQISEYLAEFGVLKVHTFEDGQAAYDFMRTHDSIDLVLCEWRLRGLSGPALVQRLHSDDVRFPVMVISSLVKKEDFSLLDEMGVAAVQSKPLRKDEFIMTISWVVQEHRQPSEQKTLQQVILKHLRKGEIAEANRYKERYLKNEQIAMGKRLFVDACFDFHTGDFVSATQKVKESIKLLGTDSLMSINLLAKCLIKMGDSKGALMCYQKAASLSPGNIERLVEMADLEIVVGDANKAAEVIDRAKSIDEEAQGVRAGESKAALALGKTLEAKKLMTNLAALDDVVATLNNRAALASKNGMLNQAIDEYKRILEALPPEEEEIAATVRYNLALAYARAQKLLDARQVLDECIVKRSRVLEKAKDLHRRVAQSIASATPLILQENQEQDKFKEIQFALGKIERRSLSEISQQVKLSTSGNVRKIGLASIYKAPAEDKILNSAS